MVRRRVFILLYWLTLDFPTVAVPVYTPAAGILRSL